VSGSFPLKSPQRVFRRNFTLFLAAIVGSSRVVCTPLLQGTRDVKAGFALLYDGIRHTLITHGRTIRYVYTRSAFLSLFPIRFLSLSLSSRRSYRAHCCSLDDSLAREWTAIYRGDGSESAARRTFFLAAGRRPKGEMGRKERGEDALARR